MIRIPELVERVADLGMPAVAVTDWHNLFGLVKFYKRAEAAGIKPIIGADLRLQDPQSPETPSVFTLLCQTNEGYLNLCRILTRSYLDGRWNGHPRVHRDWLTELSDGLIVLLGWQSDVGVCLRNGHPREARQLIDNWLGEFPDRVYIELQRLDRPGEQAAETGLLDLALATRTPVVATNDVRFLDESDYLNHEARVCIHQGRMLDDKRRSREFVAEQHFRDAEQMARAFADIPQALENTGLLAQRCNLDLEMDRVVLPDFPVPDGETVDGFLRRKSAEGLNGRLERHGLAEGKSREDYDSRLERELDVICEMGFPGYFLIVADFIVWAKKNQVPVGPGRGSGAGSVVGWALGITDVDPLRYDLLFERFLNPERVSMPDFDVDFCMEGRDRVIDYVAETYGRDQVSQIITFGTMAAKAVVRDCGRVLGHKYGHVDSIAKLIPMRPDMTLQAAYKEEPELLERKEREEDTRGILELAEALEGLARNAGKHAGGVVIAPGPLTEFTPLYTEPNGGSVVTQYDKNDVETIGLVKFDFLGLRTLTIIDWAVKFVNDRLDQEGKPLLELADIPLDDPQTFKLLQAAHTTAVFQLESRGMKDLLRKLQPDQFDDIVAAVALFRPGPLDAGMVDLYIDRKHGRAQVKYLHPTLESILSPTYGVILYQEQVMQIAQELGGYSLGAADLLRRAMGKKKPEEMARQKDLFLAGTDKTGIDRRQAEEIFGQMETFARYGFNKSHSVAYALLAYQTGWLKAHYPAEFMAAVLSADLDKSDKIAGLVEDCKAMDLTILSPDVNASGYRFQVEDGHIRYGLGAIKGLGQGAVESLVEARTRLGRFSTLDHLCQEVDLQRINRRALETLIRSGATDSLDENRAALLHHLPDIISVAESRQRDRAAGQVSLFSAPPDRQSEPAEEQEPRTPIAHWTNQQRLREEKATLGLYLSGHPVDDFREEMNAFCGTRLENLEAYSGGQKRPVTIGGLVTAVRKRPGKGGFVTLDDGTGRLDVALFDKVYQENAELLVVEEVLVVSGQVEPDRYTGGFRMVARQLMNLDTARSRFGQAVELTMHRPEDDPVRSLAAALSPYRGGAMPVIIRYSNGHARATLRLGETWNVKPGSELLAALENLPGCRARILYGPESSQGLQALENSDVAAVTGS